MYRKKIFYFTNNGYYVMMKKNKSYSTAFLARDLETEKVGDMRKELDNDI